MSNIVSVNKNILDLESINLTSLSTDELKGMMAAAVNITARYLNFLAKIYAVLEERGEDMSDFRVGLIKYLPLISSGHVDSNIIVQFAGYDMLLNNLAKLPIALQSKIANGQQIPVVTQTDDDFVTVMMDAADIPSKLLKQVFNGVKIRTEEEQIVVINASSLRETKSDNRVRKRTLAYLPNYDAFKVGTLKIRKEDIISALAAESGCHPDDLIEFLRAAKIAAKERTYEQN